METIVFNKTYTYHPYSFEDVVLVLKKIQSFSIKYHQIDSPTSSLWKIVDQLIILVEEVRIGDTFLAPLERSLISLIDVSQINEYIDFFEKIQKITNTGNKEGIIRTDVSVGVSPQNILPDISILELSHEIVLQWQTYANSALDESQKREFQDLIDGLKESFLTWKDQITSIAIILGLSRPSVTKFTERQSFSKILEGDFMTNALKIKQAFGDRKLGTDFLPVLMDLMDNSPFFELEEYEWKDIVLYTLILHLVYLRFAWRGAESQSFLLSKYFYRAIVVGVPVRKYISDSLYDTNNMVVYLNECDLFVRMIEISQEKVPTGVGKNTEKFGDILRRFVEFHKTFIGSAEDCIQKFVDQFYVNNEQYNRNKEWLKEALYIYLHLKLADLIENNKGGELTRADEAHNELAILITDFGIGDEGIQKVVDYFAQENPKVGINPFLELLQKTVDLTKEISVDECVDLQHKLQEAKLIDHDLIFFNSQTNQFEWNK